MASDLRVAYRGTVRRDDKCSFCDKPMMFRIDNDTGDVVEAFCGNPPCQAFLVEVRDGE